MQWTETCIARLKTMWGDGCSGAEIAAELGCTRSSAIAKVHRLGCSGRSKGAVRGRKRQSPSPHRDRAQRIVAPKFNAIEPGLPIAPPAVFTTEHFCTLDQLTEKSCRWPCWDDNAPLDQKFYCGAITQEALVEVIGSKEIKKRQVYCTFHSDLSYSPAPPRKQYHYGRAA